MMHLSDEAIKVGTILLRLRGDLIHGGGEICDLRRGGLDRRGHSGESVSELLIHEVVVKTRTG